MREKNNSFINIEINSINDANIVAMKNEKLAWLLFIFLSLTWGSSFILMKKSLFPVSEEEMVLNPFQVGSLRVLMAALVLLPIALKHIKKLTKKNALLLLIAGLTGNLIPAILFTIAETNIDSSLAGLLNMTTSFFVVLIGVIFYKSKPSKLQLIGLALGSTGLYLVLNSQFDPSQTKDATYAFYIFPATLCYAISLTTIKFKLNHLPSAAITSLSFLLILIPAFIIAIAQNSFDPIINHPDGLKAFGYLSILAVIGTALAVFLFTKLIAISSHIFASAVAYMLPVVAIFIGVLDGEKFDWINIIWVIVIILGVYLMNKKGKS